MKLLRATPDHRRDFAAYLRWRRAHRGFLPWRSRPFERGTVDTVTAFVQLESRGACNPPRHPRVLAAVLEGKKLLNFQIKQWAEGAADPCCTIPTELREGYPWLPDWVWKALNAAVLRQGRAR